MNKNINRISNQKWLFRENRSLVSFQLAVISNSSFKETNEIHKNKYVFNRRNGYFKATKKEWAAKKKAKLEAIKKSEYSGGNISIACEREKKKFGYEVGKNNAQKQDVRYIQRESFATSWEKMCGKEEQFSFILIFSLYYSP